MNPYMRHGDKVLNLRGAWPEAEDHRLMTTTRDFFGETEFLALRATLSGFETAQPRAYSLIGLLAGKKAVSEQDQEFLRAALQGQPLEKYWASSKRAVLAVTQWVRQHGDAIPEALLQLEGHAVLPDELAQDIQALEEIKAANPDKKESSVNDFMTSASGDNRRALRKAGLLDGTGSLSFRGRAVVAHLRFPTSGR
jgi:hypothetical protein